MEEVFHIIKDFVLDVVSYALFLAMLGMLLYTGLRLSLDVGTSSEREIARENSTE